MLITIPGDAIAKKNSQRIVRFGKRASIRPSRAYDAWAKMAMTHLQYLGLKPWAGGYPVELHLFFYRSTLRKFDLSNMIEGCQDVLQQAGVLEDDSMHHVVPVLDRRGGGYGWALDKERPRTEMQIVPAM